MNPSPHIVCPKCGAVNRIPESRLQDGPKCGKCSQPLFKAQPIELNSTNFHFYLQRNDIPLLIDFWAPWCGPCKMMGPAFAEAASQLEPHFRLAKVNTEAEQDLGSQFGIRSIPTLALFHQGKEVARQPGAMSSADIIRWARAQAI